MATLLQIPQFFDENGDPASGYQLFTYEAGTSTKKDNYTDEGGTLGSNPRVLDSEGRPDNYGIWLDGSYKLVMATADATDPPAAGDIIWTLDDVNLYDQFDFDGLTATIADLNSTTTTALTKSTDYSVQISDRGKVILVNASSAAVHINLPAAATAGNKFQITIKKIDSSANAVHLGTNGSERIDDNTATYYSISGKNDFLKLQCDSSNWHSIGYKKRGFSDETTPVGTIYVSQENRIYNINATGGAETVTLPEISTIGNGFRLTIKKTDSSANAVTINRSGTDTIDGATSYVLNTQYQAVTLVSSTSSHWRIISDYSDQITIEAYPPGYLYGIDYEQDVGDTSHDIKFQVGYCRGANNLLNLHLATSLIKRIDANWTQGTNQGGFPTALSLSTDTWYHLFVIGKPDGTVDAGYDSSITATNLLADATGYTDYRRIGSIYTNSSHNITDFHMYSLPFFKRTVYWKTLPLSLDITIPDTSRHAVVLHVPPALYTIALFNVMWNIGYGGTVNDYLYLSATTQTDQAGTAAGAPLFTYCELFTGAYRRDGGKEQLIADTARQIYYRSTVSGAGTMLKIATIGWEE